MTCPVCQAENEPSAVACIACGEPLGPEAPRFKAGATFAGRYEILGPLGRGGMGMVYRARDRDLGEVIALKVIRPDLARQSHIEQRFRSEVKLARRVRHPNVCSIYGDGEDHGLLYICMEMVDGTNLREMVRSRGGLPAAEAFDVAIQIAEGLRAIHGVGIIHRDLKTANVMRDARGVVRLMDFGIAKQWEAEGTTGATATGQVIGTPEYMSPEQIRGEKVDFRTDVYALGIVIYEIFTGVVPFRGETAVATIFKHLQDPPPLRTHGQGALPLSLVPALRRALAKSPASRYPSAAEMLAALVQARDEYRTHPDPPARSASADDVSDTDQDDAPTLAAAETRQRSGPGPAPATSAPATTATPGPVRMWTAAAALLAVLAAWAVWATITMERPVAVTTNSSIAPMTTVAPSRESGFSGVEGFEGSVPSPPSPRSMRPTASPSAPGVVATPRPPVEPVGPAAIVEERAADVPPRQSSQCRSAEYPREMPALRVGQRVSVTVAFVVMESGETTDFQVVETAGQALDDAVIAAYRACHFSPAVKDGVPVKVRMLRRQTFLGPQP